MITTLHGYTLDDEKWKVMGGGGECNIATKDGEDFFIKKPSKPRYPFSDHWSEEQKKQKIEECTAWLQKRLAISRALPGSGIGTLIKPIDYFREGACFYEVAHLVKPADVPFTELWREPLENIVLVLLTISRSLADMHSAGIVYGDLDPSNIVISRSAKNFLVTKLIDFSDAFFENNPPESIVSKEPWWSPEIALYNARANEHPNPMKDLISCKSDVFSLGIIFHQFCSENGSRPACESEYVWQEVLEERQPELSSGIDVLLKGLIASMLSMEPDDRPSMTEVHQTLLKIRKGFTEPVSIVPGEGIDSSGVSVASATLRIRGNVKKANIIFSNGREQLMDLSLAVQLGYVKKI